MSEINKDKLTLTEKREYFTIAHKLGKELKGKFREDEAKKFKHFARKNLTLSNLAHDDKNISEALLTLNTAHLFAEAVEPDKNIMLAIGLYPFLKEGLTDILSIRREWGEDIAGLLTGLESVDRFSNKNNVVNQDNFRGLLLALADDIRVIIIMIVRNLALMRMINNHPDDNWVRDVAFEANYLYAQLAHRLGLYKIKSELEDLSLKYTNREIYTQIAKKLNATKRERDAYIKAFIDPVKEKLEVAGITFDIKGRTKSISSIWNKMKKQKVDLPGIYDLFAIRVIIDTPLEKEKSDCWLAYSILADMYTANPARMRDWITIPKSNGYESLHATVMGPDSKWVEVQFRTKRMDLVAEKGLAAHWRYKGVKGDSSDQWMNNIRDILETAESGPMQLMKDMKKDVYGKEVFAFTPKGDLFRLPAGATVLDFAFLIHSNVGAHCTGGVVNGQHRKITYKISNGDTVEILTSTTQSPKKDWLNIVVSSKARNKIKQTLNEETIRKADLGKELFNRRAKNRKVEIEESVFMKYLAKNGYKHANDFFADMADGKIDPGKFLSTYLDETRPKNESTRVSAEGFQLQDNSHSEESEEIIKIGDKSINGLSYKYAKCCNPIYGDEVFGFISSDGTVKIHRKDCPNANNIRERYPYRIINATWSGVDGDMLPATLKITGKDDIGIVANITSVISKENGVNLRNISVDSNDGTFQGVLVVAVKDIKKLNGLVKKITTVKGVKQVQRV
ncbi:MAG: bifunctional (p)ppGpp synthetase/guanosine-3',5'-bis(diphosphate) 3'-pyrophosphohydrolase [Muribaculaceae bacterium]|nr:bifunctional (p)ppGpp synthetase/guanosine-3',5'-bis(diphosphate) 3'-pyrophosphohydrolase [Muribaculaceae bacterium]